jgi:hypothetical protein
MKAYCNRVNKIADGQFDDTLDCNRITKVKCNSSLKKRILRPFKKSMRQKIKQETLTSEY